MKRLLGGKNTITVGELNVSEGGKGLLINIANLSDSEQNHFSGSKQSKNQS